MATDSISGARAKSKAAQRVVNGYDRAVIAALILAAGKSERMGASKPNLVLPNGETFLTNLIRTFQSAGVEEIVVVIGHDPEPILKTLDDKHLQPRVVVNHDYESGQLSSVLAGLRALDKPGVSALLLMPVDAPLTSIDTIRRLLQRFASTHAPIVRPVNGGRHGHPVIIDRSLFSLLRSADPARGIKPIVRAHVSPRGDVEVEDENAFADLDTPDEYEKAIRGLRSR
ncbi:MAG TPA: nucleotidyltransferase family protein [Vicinamibacterales bacterium]|jgi:molybdenum cofactor cytidylyltransferase|nr:nucleotidyltransferase family protein [Vicinamibacterales bacterium]